MSVSPIRSGDSEAGHGRNRSQAGAMVVRKKPARRRKAKRPSTQQRLAALVLERRHGVEVAVLGKDMGPPERRHHDPVEETDTLVEGRLVRVRRTLDLMGTMRRNGTISTAQANAGRRFRADFDLAHFDPRRSPDLGRLRLQGRAAGVYDGGLPERIQDARNRIWSALEALGGHCSPAGHAAWHILGVGQPLAVWATAEGFADHRPLNPHTARGILIATLGVLAAHYGYLRGRSK